MGLIRKQFLLLVFFISLSKAPILIARDIIEGSKESNEIFTYHTTVYIDNNLGEGDALTVHCKSGDKDLGVQHIPNAMSFQWRFRINFFKTTLYFCGFSWRDGQGSFVVFKAKRDMDRCETNCTWSATLDGLHGYNQKTGLPDMTFGWSPPQLIS